MYTEVNRFNKKHLTGNAVDCYIKLEQYMYVPVVRQYIRAIHVCS